MICKNCNVELVDKGSFYGCPNYRTTGCKFTESKADGKVIPQPMHNIQPQPLTPETTVGALMDLKSVNITAQCLTKIFFNSRDSTQVEPTILRDDVLAKYYFYHEELSR